MRVETFYNMPDGTRSLRDHNEMRGVVSWFSHNEHKAKEQAEYTQQLRRAQELIALQAQGKRLTNQEKQFLADLQQQIQENETYEQPKPKRKPRASKTDKAVNDANKKDLANRGIN